MLAADDISSQRRFALAAVTAHGDAFSYCSHKFQDDKEILRAALSKDLPSYTVKYGFQRDRVKILRRASLLLQADKELVMQSVKQDGCSLESASQELKQDKEVVKAAVTSSPHAIEYALIDDDREIALIAIQKNPYAVKYLSNDLLEDREVVLAAVGRPSIGDHALSECALHLREDREIVLASVKTQPMSFRFASEELRSDKEIAKIAVAGDGGNISWVAGPLQDRELALQAVRQDGEAIALVNYPFYNDMELIKEAMKNDEFSRGFKSLGWELRNDRDFLMFYLEHHWQFIEHVHPNFYRDEEVMLLAISRASYYIDLCKPLLLRDHNFKSRLSLEILAFLSKRKEILWLEKTPH